MWGAHEGAGPSPQLAEGFCICTNSSSLSWFQVCFLVVDQRSSGRQPTYLSYDSPSCQRGLACQAHCLWLYWKWAAASITPWTSDSRVRRDGGKWASLPLGFPKNLALTLVCEALRRVFTQNWFLLVTLISFHKFHSVPLVGHKIVKAK